MLTGKPGVGKTTLVRKVVAQMSSVPMAGFFTAEIRSKGHRIGFELKGLNGPSRMLAHVAIQSKHRVGRYGVDTSGFELFLKELDLLNPDVELIVIDEIGKMELFSSLFRNLIRKVLDTDKLLLSTIALHGKGIIEEIKQRPDIHLLEVTPYNRDHLMADIID